MIKKLLSIAIIGLVLGYGQSSENISDIKLKLISGKSSTIGNYLGKGPVLVNFWATWCAPCKKEMRHLKALSEDVEDLTIIAINQDKTRSNSLVKSYVRSNKFKFEIALDPNGQIFQKFNASAVPTSILLNAKGKIEFVHQGYAPGDEKKIKKEILKLIKADSE